MISDDTYEEETGDLAKTDPAPASFVKVITYMYLACWNTNIKYWNNF